MAFQIKYPEVHVQLTGKDGNAFAIIGRVQRAMQAAGIPQAEIEAFIQEATSGDYNHLLQTAMKTVNTY